MANVSFKVDENALLNALDIKLDELSDEIFADSQDNIVSKGIINEGTLLKSGKIIRNFLDKSIVYSVPYAESIEFGRSPGSMPPVDPIALWVKQKGIAKDNKQAKSIAFAIANDIKINGQQPRPFLSPAVAKARAKLN